MRRLTPEQLPAVLGRLPSNPRIVVPGNFATPQLLLSVIDDALPAYILHALNAQVGVPIRPGVTLETAFVGPGMRQQPGLHYLPCRLSLVPVLFQRSLPPDMVVVHTSPAYDGAVSLGIEVNVLPAALDAVRARGGIVVAQVNSQMPYTYGDAELPLDEIDYFVEVDEPLPQAGFPAPDDVSEAIGDLIAGCVPDGATLQLGIGAIPDAVLRRLAQQQDLRLYSEMFSDGIWHLERAGKLDSEVPLVASFIFGSTELYSWVHRNPRVRMMRTEITNDPARIARQRTMTSVNGALQVDISAQANASRIGGRIYSGFGGSTDFIVGALHSPGGHAYMALPSWHPRAEVSTIVPQIEGPVTSFQHSAVVTEQGMAQVFGNSEAEQTHQIIDRCAHPDARPELWQAAKRMGRA